MPNKAVIPIWTLCVFVFHSVFVFYLNCICILSEFVFVFRHASKRLDSLSLGLYLCFVLIFVCVFLENTSAFSVSVANICVCICVCICVLYLCLYLCSEKKTPGPFRSQWQDSASSSWLNPFFLSFTKCNLQNVRCAFISFWFNRSFLSHSCWFYCPQCNLQ